MSGSVLAREQVSGAARLSTDARGLEECASKSRCLCKRGRNGAAAARDVAPHAWAAPRPELRRGEGRGEESHKDPRDDLTQERGCYRAPLMTGTHPRRRGMAEGEGYPGGHGAARVAKPVCATSNAV